MPKPPRKSRCTPPASGAQTSRDVALTVLSEVLFNGSVLQTSLHTSLEAASLSSQERGLATELTYGYLRTKGLLDTLLHVKLSKLKKLPPEMLLLLGLASYELAYLTRVPAYATLSDAVTRAKKLWGRTLANLANGVLRAINRDLQGVALENFLEAQLGKPAAHFVLPAWIFKMLEEQYPKGIFEQYLSRIQLPPEIGVRYNVASDSTSQNGQRSADRIRLVYYPWTTTDQIEIADTEALVAQEKRGQLTRQSLAVGKVLTQLKYTTWEEPLWDACCGRGGKSLPFLEAGKRIALASDPNWTRLKGYTSEVKRLGLLFPMLIQARAEELVLQNTVKTVIADVPCSGLGVLSRRPDTLWRLRPEDVKEFTLLQAKILQSTAQNVAPGGKLIYLTCTVNKAENEDQVRAFLQANSGWKLGHEVLPNVTDSNEWLYGALLERET